jgi:hypothetical protein
MPMGLGGFIDYAYRTRYWAHPHVNLIKIFQNHYGAILDPQPQQLPQAPQIYTRQCAP